jgi:hypothetical protein
MSIKKYRPETKSLEEILTEINSINPKEEQFVLTLSYHREGRVDSFVVTNEFPLNDFNILRRQLSETIQKSYDRQVNIEAEYEEENEEQNQKIRSLLE